MRENFIHKVLLFLFTIVSIAMMVFAGFGIDGRFVVGFGITLSIFLAIQSARKNAITLLNIKHSLQTSGLYYLIFGLLL